MITHLKKIKGLKIWIDNADGERKEIHSFAVILQTGFSKIQRGWGIVTIPNPSRFANTLIDLRRERLWFIWIWKLLLFFKKKQKGIT